MAIANLQHTLQVAVNSGLALESLSPTAAVLDMPKWLIRKSAFSRLDFHVHETSTPLSELPCMSTCSSVYQSSSKILISKRVSDEKSGNLTACEPEMDLILIFKSRSPAKKIFTSHHTQNHQIKETKLYYTKP